MNTTQGNDRETGDAGSSPAAVTNPPTKDTSMHTLDHAERELKAIKCDSDVSDLVKAFLKEFTEQRHSGASASICGPSALKILEKLIAHEPLTPLTGKRNECVKISVDLWQNKRCGRVFKDKDHAWDIDGKVFIRPDGVSYTSRKSRVTVTFPYTPTTKYVKVRAGK